MAARSCVLLSVFLYLAPCHVHIKDIPHSSLHTSSTSAQGSIGWSIATISWIKIRCPELHIWRRGGTARWLSHHPLIRNYPWRFRSLWTRPKHASRSACSIVGCSQLVSSQKMTPYTQPDQSTTHETEVTDIRTPGITQMVVRRNLCFIANDDHIKYHPLCASEHSELPTSQDTSLLAPVFVEQASWTSTCCSMISCNARQLHQTERTQGSGATSFHWESYIWLGLGRGSFEA